MVADLVAAVAVVAVLEMGATAVERAAPRAAVLADIAMGDIVMEDTAAAGAHTVVEAHIALTPVATAIAAVDIAVAAIVEAALKAIAEMEGKLALKVLSLLFALRENRQLRRQSLQGEEARNQRRVQQKLHRPIRQNRYHSFR